IGPAEAVPRLCRACASRAFGALGRKVDEMGRWYQFEPDQGFDFPLTKSSYVGPDLGGVTA
ncbi:hypothetical protein, partial [uncultured Amaricoccus sp.]|uniref:hypothetical protein n=1 Tax=uncultured Amaricoccus sp. TaxID=339341 RepID=UPI00261477ED